MSQRLARPYEAPGPIAAAFMKDRSPVDMIMGPIGSGKTSANLMTHVYRATEQAPSLLDGVRKYYLSVIRATYRQLWETTIPSWWEWMPKAVGHWEGAKDSPALHTIKFRENGVPILYQVEFVAIGEQNIEDVLRGKQRTAFALEEVDLLGQDVLNYCRGRAGRYPAMREGGPTWYGVTGTFNAPDVDSWAYDSFFQNRADSYAVHVQPGGLDPDAENRSNLPPGYYENQMDGQPDWYIRRMIHNQFGASRAGMPVFPEFNDRRHVAAAPIAFDRGLKLRIGLDCGMDPAAALLQQSPSGQWRGLNEVVSEHGTGPRRFSDDLNRLLREFCPGLRREDVEAFVDPNATYGADKIAGDDNWLEIVGRETGLRIRPAPTNKLHPRREALRRHLKRTIDGTVPGFILSPVCRVWRRGLNSGFRFRKILVPGDDKRWSEEPEKNEWSHICEAGEYGLLGGDEYSEVMGRRRASRSFGGQQEKAIEDFEPGTGLGYQIYRMNRGKQTTALDE